MSEVDVRGTILHSYTDVVVPCHLSLDSEGHVLVADCGNHRILLLNSQLQLQRVLVDTNSKSSCGRQHDYVTTNSHHNSTLYTAAAVSGRRALTSSQY